VDKKKKAQLIELMTQKESAAVALEVPPADVAWQKVNEKPVLSWRVATPPQELCCIGWSTFKGTERFGAPPLRR